MPDFFTKLKLYKSLKPVVKHFNILRYINFSKYCLQLRTLNTKIALRNRIFLNKKVIKKSLTYFLYKKVKYKLTKFDVKKTA